MGTRVFDRVEEWGDRPFTGGYGELHDLASDGFSGVVRAGGTELAMIEGTVVGVRGGTVEDFEGVRGTLHEAPTPALPLLAVMQERADEVRAQYYSEDTSIATVDSKLEEAGFTGYIELSENVLSGDYYVVYHRGNSMSAAFVGTSSQLLEDEEAFERANGEVGIYKVYPVDVEPVEIPEPSDPAPAGPTDGDVTDDSTGTDARDATAAATDAAGDSDAVSEPSGDGDADAPDEENQSGATATAQSESASASEAETTADADEAPASRDVSTGDKEESDAETATASSAGGTAPAGAAEREREPPAADAPETAGGSTDASASPPATEEADAAGEREARGSGPAAAETAPRRRQERPDRARSQGADALPADSDGSHLETKAIPSLSPDRTQTTQSERDASGQPERSARESGGNDGAGSESRRGVAQSRRAEPPGESDAPPRTGEVAGRRTGTDGEPSRAAETERADSAETVAADRVEDLEDRLADREAEVERLESELESATDERDRLREELDGVRTERDELAAEVERLETELDGLETELGAATDRERRIAAGEALDGTDVFVRYRSKGDATLEKAHDGATPRADVIENLRLETHTQFDADAVAVNGQTYAEFVEGTVVYQFVEWVAEDLLFEIRDTGHADALGTLYDAVPKIDRAELNGSVDVVYTEDGAESRSTEAFDVVLRDRMGSPLVVANLNDSREAATESMMERLITSAERVGQTSEEFAAAFLVTRSFFEPAALETASEATRGGLLSRSKHKSFVNLTRKRGYHLCLVEARSENFNLTVPEL